MSSTDSYDFKYAKENIEYTSKFGKSLDEDNASREWGSNSWNGIDFNDVSYRIYLFNENKELIVLVLLEK